MKVGFDFDKMISPLDSRQFFEEYWEQNLLLIPRDNPDFYHELLTIADIDRVISTFGLRYPSLRMVKNGISIPLPKYTYTIPWSGESFSRMIDAEVVFSEFHQGATIVMEALHSNWLPLGLFCRNLETFFNCPVQSNIYLTPKHSQGFAAHYDTHDVFVLQVAGAKRWRIYEGPVHLPDRSQPFKKENDSPGKLLLDQELKAGDMLYLPRGFMHEGLTSDNDSLHITVGIISYTWVDIFSEALTQIKKDSAFHSSLPPGFALEDSRLPQEKFAELLQKFSQTADLDKLSETIASRFISGRRPILDGQLNQLRYLEKLDANSRLERRSGILCKLETGENSVTLSYNGKQVNFPGFVEPILRFILEQGSESFNLAALPGKLDEAGKLVLVRRLVKEGFLVVD